MIPEKYCPDLHDRLSFYQRFASADSPTALEGVQAELEDLIGEAPIEVLALKTNMLIKLALKEIYALKLEISVLNPGQYSVAILPSQKTPIILSKLKELMTKDSGLRITPQHKVIQIINSSSEQPAVFYEIALKAIANLNKSCTIIILTEEIFMGKLINGKWHDQWYDTESNKGEFIRESSPIHNWITLDGNAGPSGVGGFKAESGRYHLYVSLACPWAHRTLIFRKLKSLEKLISVSIVSPHMLENGWSFAVNEGSTGDSVNHFDYLYQVYTANDPHYTGRVTVPVLWDKQKNTIVNNDSS